MLYDYFRASDAEAVAELMADLDGGPVVRASGSPMPDAIDAKWLDPSMVLSWVIAFALDVPWDIHLAGDELVWPGGAGRDMEYQGPWVVAIGESARDALADIPEDRMPELAERWSRIDELAQFDDMSPELMLSFLRQFVRLAGNARTSGETVYCWMSL